MQTRFLSQVSPTLKPLAPLTLAHGDEVVLQWLIDLYRPQWQAQNFEIKRIELNHAKDWLAACGELHTLTLFATQSIIIVSGKHKPDNEALKQLVAFAEAARAGNSSHQLIWLSAKHDKKSQATKVFSLFAKDGLVIDANIYQESDRSELLHFWARQFHLDLSSEAWQLLLSHTEHDVLGGYQNLWQLSFLSLPSPIEAEDLQRTLTDGGSFSVFDLSDALIAGNLTHSLKVLNHLQNTDAAASIVLWAISKDIHSIAALKNGADPQSLGIWRSKIGSYNQAARRLSQVQIDTLLTLTFQADCAIKGVNPHNPWQLIRTLVMQFCGFTL